MRQSQKKEAFRERQWDRNRVDMERKRLSGEMRESKREKR